MQEPNWATSGIRNHDIPQTTTDTRNFEETIIEPTASFVPATRMCTYIH
jgi:hypothetical protein